MSTPTFRPAENGRSLPATEPRAKAHGHNDGCADSRRVSVPARFSGGKFFSLPLRLFAFLCLFSLIACTPQSTNQPINQSTNQPINLPTNFDRQGHRGARALKPENTLPAFETALDLGVTTLELDLHLTADQIVVIWHDPTISNDKCQLKPDTTIEAPDPDSLIYQGDKLNISNLTFAQLKAYRCDLNPSPNRYPDQTNTPTALAGDNHDILSLEELFVFVADYATSADKSDAQRTSAAAVQFNIETKRKPDDPSAINDNFDGQNPAPFETEIIALVEQYDLTERVILQSFDHRSLWAARQLNDQIRLAALTRDANVDFANLVEQGAAIWSPNFEALTAVNLADAQASGLQVIPWTVNDPDAMTRLIDLGVDGIITDRPDLLLNQTP